MRKYILAVLVVATAVAAMGLTVNHYKNYQTLKTNTEEAEALAEKNAVLEAEGRFIVERQAMNEKYNDLRLQCERGLAAWNELSTFAQRTLEEPQCGLVLVQPVN